MFISRVLLLLISLLCQGTITTLADEAGELPTCEDPTNAEALLDQPFDTIRPGDDDDDCSSPFNERHLAPKDIHWHIYQVEDGETPRISMYPEGLVTPKFSGSTLKFETDKDRVGWSNGDVVEAGVQLYIPASQLRKVQLDGVDAIVEVVLLSDVTSADDDNNSTDNTTTTEVEPKNNNNNDDDILEVIDSGVDNKVYVTSPNIPVRYRASGVDSEAYMEAASGSSIELTGVDNKVHIASPLVTEIRMTGVDQKVTLEGDYEELKMTGVSGTVLVNGQEGCDGSFRNSGVSNKCRTTTETVLVPTLDCYADTTISKQSCAWGLSRGAAVGVSLGALAFVVTISVICCYCCFKCCACCDTGGRHSSGKPIGQEEQYYATQQQQAATPPIYPNKDEEAAGSPVVSDQKQQQQSSTMPPPSPPPEAEARVIQQAEPDVKKAETTPQKSQEKKEPQKELYAVSVV